MRRSGKRNSYASKDQGASPSGKSDYSGWGSPNSNKGRTSTGSNSPPKKWIQKNELEEPSDMVLDKVENKQDRVSRMEERRLARESKYKEDLEWQDKMHHEK